MKPKILKMLLSLGLAIALWAYVVTTVSPESDMNFSDVPVTLQGEALLQEVGYMVTDMDVSGVDLRLQGSRMDLERIKTSDIRIALDVSKNPVAGTHELPYSVSFTGDVDQGAVSVISKSPATILVTVEPRDRKSIDIEVETKGETAPGFKPDAENLSLTYNDQAVSHISITGPRSSLEKIKKAKITVDLTNKTETFIEGYDIVLCDEDGVPVDKELLELVEQDIKQVTLTMKILVEKEISVVPNVIYGGGATEENTSITCTPATIKVSGNTAVMDTLTQLDLGQIDLSQYVGPEPLTLKVSLPEGVNNEDGVTEVQVDIVFENLLTKTLNVQEFTMESMPAGLSAEVLDQQLEIMIRGEKGAVNGLKRSDVKVKIDLSGIAEGEHELEAVVEIDDPKIGVIGTYKVKVKVTKAPTQQ